MDFKGIVQNTIADDHLKRKEIINLSDIDRLFEFRTSRKKEEQHEPLKSEMYFALNASIIENIEDLKKKYDLSGILDLFENDRFYKKLFQIIKTNTSINKLMEEESECEDDEFNEQLVFN